MSNDGHLTRTQRATIRYIEAIRRKVKPEAQRRIRDDQPRKMTYDELMRSLGKR